MCKNSVARRRRSTYREKSNADVPYFETRDGAMVNSFRIRVTIKHDITDRVACSMPEWITLMAIGTALKSHIHNGLWC